MKNQFKLFLVVTLSLLMSLSTSDSCQPIIQDAITTLNTLNYQLFFQISQIKAQKWVSFGEDEFVVKTKTGTTINYLYAQDVKTAFSDRGYCVQNSTGPLFTICILTQQFDAKKQDTSQISLYLDSSFEVILTTWGNTKLTSTVECKNGFIYGWLT